MNVFGVILIILLIIILIFFFSIAIPILIVVGIIYLIYWIIKSASNNNKTVYYETYNNANYASVIDNTSQYNTNTMYEPIQDYYNITVNGYGDGIQNNTIPGKISEYCVNKKLSEGGDYESAIASCEIAGGINSEI